MGEVTQADRDFAARWIVIAPENIKLTREGKFDHHSGVQAARQHRLSNTAHSGGEIERVARAIEIAFVEKTMHHPVSKLLNRMGWIWKILARAALAAMRTPS